MQQVCCDTFFCPFPFFIPSSSPKKELEKNYPSKNKFKLKKTKKKSKAKKKMKVLGNQHMLIRQRNFPSGGWGKSEQLTHIIGICGNRGSTDCVMISIVRRSKRGQFERRARRIIMSILLYKNPECWQSFSKFPQSLITSAVFQCTPTLNYDTFCPFHFLFPPPQKRA